MRVAHEHSSVKEEALRLQNVKVNVLDMKKFWNKLTRYYCIKFSSFLFYSHFLVFLNSVETKKKYSSNTDSNIIVVMWKHLKHLNNDGNIP